MTLCFYVLMSLGLILVQTTILPYFMATAEFYDLLLPMVVFFGLFRPAREGIFAAVTLGLLSGGLSGGHFALFLTTYLWIFGIIRAAIQLVHVGFHLMLPVSMALAVVVENLIIWGVTSILEPAYRTFFPIVKLISVQVLWAVVTGPPLVALLTRSHRKLNALRLRRSDDAAVSDSD